MNCIDFEDMDTSEWTIISCRDSGSSSTTESTVMGTVGECTTSTAPLTIGWTAGGGMEALGKVCGAAPDPVDGAVVLAVKNC
jgi:hypothetical protein